MKIFIADKRTSFTDDQISLLQSKGEVTFIETSEDWKNNQEILTQEEKILALDPNVCEWSLSHDLLDKIPNIKAICVPTTRYGWIDPEYIKSKNILLTNVPKYSTESVAEHAIFQMLSLAKKIVMISSNNWKLDYDKHLGKAIKGKQMGIIGLGEIGTKIAEFGNGLGMNVCYWSRSSRDDRFEYLELKELLKTSDYLFLAVADNSETKNFLSNEMVDMVKKDACIISVTGNVAWDFNYVSEKVKKGDLYGIAVDDESTYVNSSEINIFVTPHMAWYTKDSVEEDYRIWVNSVISVIDGNPINTVN